MVDWAHAFDCPVYVHAANRPWVMRSDESIEFGDGETIKLGTQMTLVSCGGHFPGSAVLHHGRDGGEIFTGDTFHVNPDRRSVGVMYGFPNYIPVSATKVRQVVAAIEPYEFRRVYRQWWDAVIPYKSKDVIRHSAERYAAAVEGKYD